MWPIGTAYVSPPPICGPKGVLEPRTWAHKGGDQIQGGGVGQGRCLRKGGKRQLPSLNNSLFARSDVRPGGAKKFGRTGDPIGLRRLAWGVVVLGRPRTSGDGPGRPRTPSIRGRPTETGRTACSEYPPTVFGPLKRGPPTFDSDNPEKAGFAELDKSNFRSHPLLWFPKPFMHMRCAGRP